MLPGEIENPRQSNGILQVTKNIKYQLHIYHLKTLKTLKRERNVS